VSRATASAGITDEMKWPDDIAAELPHELT
jgi:hypothetical protein